AREIIPKRRQRRGEGSWYRSPEHACATRRTWDRLSTLPPPEKRGMSVKPNARLPQPPVNHATICYQGREARHLKSRTGWPLQRLARAVPGVSGAPLKLLIENEDWPLPQAGILTTAFLQAALRAQWRRQNGAGGARPRPRSWPHPQRKDTSRESPRRSSAARPGSGGHGRRSPRDTSCDAAGRSYRGGWRAR